MSKPDIVEFIQAVLITIFLSCLYSLIPKLLSTAALTARPFNPRISSFLGHLYRHNPLHQWIAERQIYAQVVSRNYTFLPYGSSTSQNIRQWRHQISPSKRWLKIIFVYVTLYLIADLLAALTILATDSYPGSTSEVDNIFPAFPVENGLNNMRIRGNCKWKRVNGSGETYTRGYIVYQLCADVFPRNESEALLQNEIDIVADGKKYKGVLNLETITQNDIIEDWRVSKNNEPRLSEAREGRNYLADCDGNCQRIWRSDGIENAIIQQILKEVGMVPRTLMNYNNRPNFDPPKELVFTRNRIRGEVLYVMITVIILTVVWGIIDMSKVTNETDYAIAIRLFREKMGRGGGGIRTIVDDYIDPKPSFIPHHVQQSFTLPNLSLSKERNSETDTERALKHVCQETDANISQLDITNVISSPGDEEGQCTLDIELDRQVALYTYCPSPDVEARDGLAIQGSKKD